MIILGIDPGFSRTGYGVIEVSKNCATRVASGAIVTHVKEQTALRLKVIYDELCCVIEEYSPDSVALENVFMGKNPNSAIKLGQVRGVAFLAAASKDIHVFEYAAKEVKIGITGYGLADKNQVADMVLRILKLGKFKFKCEDESDALALAIYHANHYGTTQKVRGNLA